MKIAKKLTAIAISTLMMFSIAGMNVFAASTTQDGLEVSLTTDKETYSKDEKITATLSVKNMNAAAVNDISLENIVPNGYEVSGNSTSKKSIQILEAGASESLVTDITAVKKTQESEVSIDKNVPPTSDNDKALYIAIAVLVLSFVIIVVCVKNKKGKQLLSVFLCVALVGTTIPLTGFVASAKTLTNQVTVSESIKVDGKTLALDSKISYSLVTADTENLMINLDGVLYDSESKIYYQTEEMSKLTGTLENVFNVKKANCTVKDANNKVLVDKDFEPEKQWTVDDFAMIVGVNTVTVSVEYVDGKKDEKTIKINNINEKNMDTLNVDKNDDDKDGVLNFIEELYHTDLKNEDSDKDGLSDYYEMAILGTNPNNPDSDGNGVSDADEDFDKDGLTNIDEIKKYNTDPTCIDSDGDTISDLDEINKYKTNPNEPDTDKDGKDDNWEIENGYDPIIPNADFPEEEEETNTLPDGVEVSSTEFVRITEIDDDFFINPSTPGYIGVKPISVEIESGKSAEITIKYEPSALDEGEQPTLYRFNEDTQRYEEVPSEVTSDGEVKANVDESGVYILLNHRYVNDVWSNDIISSSDDGLVQGDLDIAFVIDCSGSMDDNDSNNIRQAVVKEFINKLRANDSAAIIKYASKAETLVPLTKDKNLLITSIDSVRTENGCDAGTNGSAGLRNALTELEKSKAPHKYIIFLTDGYDTEHSEPYFDDDNNKGLVTEIAEQNIIVHTIGLVGTGSVDIDLLKKIASQTGGNYYLATAGGEIEIAPDVLKLEDVYDDIEKITIGKLQDSNEDGISDYYTKLMCEGKILTSKGTKIFGDATYEEVQEKIGDFDGDGLINGTKVDPNTGKIIEKGEIELTYDSLGVYAKIYSYPNNTDSDNDGLNDYIETKSGTDPLKKNAFVDKVEVDSFTNSENFYSNIYLKIYNNSAFEQGSVFIGNAFFGSTLDQTNLYRQALIEYFGEIDADIVNNKMINNYRKLSEQFIGESFEQIFDVIREDLELGKKEDYENKIAELSELINSITDIAGTPNTLMEHYDSIKSVIEELYLLKETKQISRYNACTKQIREYMELVPNYVTDTTRSGWTDFLNQCSANINSCGQKIGKFENKITIKLAKLDEFFKGMELINSITMYINIGMTAWDSYMDYCDILSSGQAIIENIYILDCIRSSSDNVYLISAADNLRCYFTDSYSKGFRELYLDAMIVSDAGTKIALDLIHNFALESGNIPLMIIEGVRLFGNLVYGMDELAENASKTVALAATSDVLSKNYLAHLNGGYAVVSNDNKYWIAYKDYSDKIHSTFINIAEARKCAENTFAKWQDDKDVKSGCTNNAEKCTEIVKKYLARFLAFNCLTLKY